MDHLVARAVLGVLRLVYRTKDRELGHLIHETAGLYDTRPQDGWRPPADWPCWQADADQARAVDAR